MQKQKTGSTKTALSGKSAQKERLAQLEQQRKRTQQLILLAGAVVVLVAVVIVIALSSVPPEAKVPDGLATKFDGFQMGMTEAGKDYPLQFPTLGNPNAPVKLEEVSSFSCPACLQYHDTIIEGMMDKIKAGQLYYVYLPTTLTGTEYPADKRQTVTSAGYCALQQGKFWQMHETLFAWQSQYASSAGDIARLNAAATALGMDGGKFSACMNSSDTKKYLDASDKYVSEVKKMTGTPAVFLFVNGKQVPPQTQSPNLTEGSVSDMPLGELRGIVEANAKS